jgi:hypothetical protein
LFLPLVVSVFITRRFNDVRERRNRVRIKFIEEVGKTVTKSLKFMYYYC